jgi:hypothetical protein
MRQANCRSPKPANLRIHALSDQLRKQTRIYIAAGQHHDILASAIDAAGQQGRKAGRRRMSFD